MKTKSGFYDEWERDVRVKKDKPGKKHNNLYHKNEQKNNRNGTKEKVRRNNNRNFDEEED